MYQLAINNDTGPGVDNIYYSIDYGATWSTQKTSIITGSNYVQCISCAISASGKYMYVSAIGSSAYFLYSNTYGASWSYYNTAPYGQIATSANGQYITVVGGNLATNLYKSSNYGLTFTASSTILSNTSMVTLSASGQYQIVVLSVASRPYYSSDFGVTWNIASSGFSVDCSWVASSATGQFAITLANPLSGTDYIYYTNDYGNTWLRLYILGVPRVYYTCAISASGQYIVVSDQTGNIFTSKNVDSSMNLSVTSTTSPSVISFVNDTSTTINGLVYGRTQLSSLGLEVYGMTATSGAPPMFISLGGSAGNIYSGSTANQNYFLYNYATSRFEFFVGGTGYYYS